MARAYRKERGVNDRDGAQEAPHDAPVGPRANPAALVVADAARLLSAAGGQRITAEMIAADVATGAPTNGDGTINLVHFAAWLVKEMATLGD
jgi:hypothetical protein